MSHSATQSKYQTRAENALSKCVGSAQPSSSASRQGRSVPPKSSPMRARSHLRALGLSETKTIRSLGPVQKARILTMLEMIAGGVRVDRVAEIIMSER